MIGEKITTKGGKSERTIEGREVVYKYHLHPTNARSEFIVIKVYTSIQDGSLEVRPNGEDAIRVIIGSISTGEFKSVHGSTLVKRTAPNGIEDRVGAFLERLTMVIRDVYRFGLSVPLCKCGRHMAKRKGFWTGNGKEQKLFWGCTTYPVCKNTKNI